MSQRVLLCLHHCDACRVPIWEEESYWSVDVNHEVAEGGMIRVLYAEAYLTYCEACAAQRDFPSVHVPSKQGANPA